MAMDKLLKHRNGSSNPIVRVCDVKDLIIKEIKRFLVKKGYDENQFEIVYGEWCLFLDDRIALMHKQGTKKRDYTIPFSSFSNIIDQIVQQLSLQERIL